MRSKNKIFSILLFLLTFTVLSQSGVTIIDSIHSGGIFRKFRLYVPTIYNGSSAVPLILNLHGYTSNAVQQQGYSNFMPLADTADFLVVHPEGTGPANAQFWNAGFGAGVNDVQFLSDLIDSLRLTYNIDPDRIYSCGMSNGGIMSYYLACNLPNKIAAIASVSGSMLNAWFSCVPARPFPVMEIHGTKDSTVKYLGDAVFAPIDSVVKKWRVHNQCNASAVTYSVPDINVSDNSTAINFKYTGGDEGTSVELYKIIGGGHSWPGAIPVLSNTNEDFSATNEIWRFFRNYKLSQFITGMKTIAIEQNLINVFPNPSSSIVTVDGIKKASLRLLSLDGIVLLTSETSSVDIAPLKTGMYILEIKSGNISKRIKILKD